jgi:phosphoglycolate phosphatase
MSDLGDRGRPAALIFDLDGTLVDSRRDLATGVNRMRADFGLAPLALEQVVLMVGEGARRLVEKAVQGELPPERIDEAFERYRRHYRDVALDTTKPYPGIEEMLAALEPAYPLAVLSNKGEAMSRLVLDGLGLTRHFRALVGGDSLPTRKPDPAGLALLAERLGLPLQELMLIGDSRIDAATARNAGSHFARVDWGFPRAGGEPEIPADLVAARPEDLAVALLDR